MLLKNDHQHGCTGKCRPATYTYNGEWVDGVTGIRTFLTVHGIIIIIASGAAAAGTMTMMMAWAMYSEFCVYGRHEMTVAMTVVIVLLAGVVDVALNMQINLIVDKLLLSAQRADI